MGDGSSGVSHDANAANIQHIVRRNQQASAEQGSPSGTFLNIFYRNIGMPERSLVGRIGRGIHHARDIPAIFLKQGVDTEWPCVSFLALPPE